MHGLPNLKICCILLVDSVESMMMHGLANTKFTNFNIGAIGGDLYKTQVRLLSYILPGYTPSL